MKKIYLSIIACLFITGAFSQSQRLVLMEEFTQASCPPCAATNPGFNALLNANANKIVSIKYQTDWPGYDPMNQHNPTQVQTRVNVYSVSGVPDAEEDGNVFNDHPGVFEQSNIDSRYAVPSPFEFRITHTLSANNDSVYVNAVIKATTAVSGNLKAFLAVIERNIYFTTPPGSNGEKHFEGVMKRMLPSDQGLTLPGSFAVNDSVVMDESWALANVYDLNQLAVVGFVQDMTTKEVHQAGYSRTHMPLDIGATHINVAFVSCSSTITPDVEVTNFGTDPITSCTLNYKVDGGPFTPYAWSGTIPVNGSVLVTLPAITLTPGAHIITVYTSDPNASTDLDVNNDQTAVTTNYTTTVVPAPIIEGFTATTFPPVNWLRNNPDNGFTWTRLGTTGGFGQTPYGCAKMDYYSSTAGNIDELFTPRFDLTNAGSPTTLDFSVAHARYDNNYYDSLAVLVSIDCGMSWTNVWGKGGSVLATAPNTMNAFTPTATQWRAESVNMDAYAGQPEVLVKFQAISGYGNNGYVDDINIHWPVGIAENSSDNSVSVYPSLSSGIVNVELKSAASSRADIVVCNNVGETVKGITVSNTAAGKYILDLKNISSGVYYVKVSVNNETIAKQITILK
ncbi:MAG TPA: T9SS type A sorting domain-containing protein [Bacteroidia bacterium]|nr:T9SS type A sorting domain-containing protein [Bacteroidia bacterium]